MKCHSKLSEEDIIRIADKVRGKVLLIYNWKTGKCERTYSQSSETFIKADEFNGTDRKFLNCTRLEYRLL